MAGDAHGAAAFGVAFTFTVTTTGGSVPKITRTGRLPSGVRFSDKGDGTAVISGIPEHKAAGVYLLTLTARDKTGSATQAFTLTVTRAPAIRKIRAARARVGVVLRLTIRSTGYPLPVLAESGPLPAGLSFTENGNGTAVIADTPAAGSSGRYPITITATNTYGTATRVLTIVVSQRRRRWRGWMPIGHHPLARLFTGRCGGRFARASLVKSGESRADGFTSESRRPI